MAALRRLFVWIAAVIFIMIAAALAAQWCQRIISDFAVKNVKNAQFDLWWERIWIAYLWAGAAASVNMFIWLWYCRGDTKQYHHVNRHFGRYIFLATLINALIAAVTAIISSFIITFGGQVVIVPHLMCLLLTIPIVGFIILLFVWLLPTNIYLN